MITIIDTPKDGNIATPIITDNNVDKIVVKVGDKLVVIGDE